MREGRNTKFGYLLVGMGMGALVGVLRAPQSGDDTRAFLSQKAKEAKRYAQHTSREWQQWAENVAERSQRKAGRLARSISAAVDASREAYHNEMSGRLRGSGNVRS